MVPIMRLLMGYHIRVYDVSNIESRGLTALKPGAPKPRLVGMTTYKPACVPFMSTEACILNPITKLLNSKRSFYRAQLSPLA